jgi:hypothetical protein
MPNRSSKQGPKDINETAFRVLSEAVGDIPASERTKNPHAAALGRLGGLKGGKARAEKLTPKERSDIAKKAAQARWGKETQSDADRQELISA